MTRLDFHVLCGQLLIDPGVALENDDLRAALRDLNDEEVARILEEEF